MTPFIQAYPPKQLTLVLKEFQSYCEEILKTEANTSLLLLEAHLYGQLIALLDQYNLKTNGITIQVKVGYYQSDIWIKSFGESIGKLAFPIGQIRF